MDLRGAGRCRAGELCGDVTDRVCRGRGEALGLLLQNHTGNKVRRGYASLIAAGGVNDSTPEQWRLSFFCRSPKYNDQAASGSGSAAPLASHARRCRVDLW